MASVRIICRCHPWAAFWWESLQKSLTKSTRRSLFFFWTSVTTGIAKYGLAQRGGPHQSALGQSRHPSSSWRTKRVQRQYQRQGCDCRDIVRQPLGAGGTFFLQQDTMRANSDQARPRQIMPGGQPPRKRYHMRRDLGRIVAGRGDGGIPRAFAPSVPWVPAQPTRPSTVPHSYGCGAETQ